MKNQPFFMEKKYLIYILLTVILFAASFASAGIIKSDISFHINPERDIDVDRLEIAGGVVFEGRVAFFKGSRAISNLMESGGIPNSTPM